MRIHISLIFILFCTLIVAQEIPPIRNFFPDEYQGENQNWGISQAESGILYVANNKGLLEYNGASWSLYPSPNQTLMRSVHVVADRIYSGSYMDFGFWEKDNFGILSYTSLTNELDIELVPDEEFWGIFSIDDFVAFQSLDRIYIFSTQTKSLKVIEGQTRIPKAFLLGKELYFQRQNIGIFKLEEGTEVLVSDNPQINADEIIALQSIDQGLLIVTRNEGLYALKNGLLEIWNPDTHRLLEEKSVYSSLKLQDGTLLLGTISNGLIHLDSQGNLISQIDQSTGLGNNTVLSIYEDSGRNVWLGLDNGISCINQNSPYRIYNDRDGRLGSIYDAVVHEGNLYLGTNQGLFYRDSSGTGSFRLVPDTEGQVWNLKKVGDDLLCGHHKGTFKISGGRAELLVNVPGTWTIKTVEERDDLLLQGNYDGIYVLVKKGLNWELRNKINGFEHSSRYLENLGNSLWVNHEFKGLFRLKVDEGYLEVLTQHLDTALRSPDSGLLKFENELLFGYQDGILRYDPNLDELVQDSILSRPILEEGYDSGKLIADPGQDRLWFFTKEHIYYTGRDNLTGKPRLFPIPLSESVRSGINGYESIRPVEQGRRYLLGTNSGFMTITMDDMGQDPFKVLMDKITLEDVHGTDADKIFMEHGNERVLTSSQTTIHFSYGVPVYQKFAAPRFQYRLNGLYNEWSPWSAISETTFENLPHGTYTFEVRARIGDRMSDNIASFNFSIPKPWFRTNLAYTLYFVGFILLGFLVHNIYRFYYKRRQRQIIEKNRREMELTRAQNEREIVKLKNKQLKQDFKNKSNELAASTMSLIKKNELLTKVKTQLSQHDEQNNSIKSVIRIIDKNLNQNDDWEFFKKAFDNADREFLDKLKQAHPNLSQNDIRLCAYLRLNLSSKEIAPLFNISPRSVEIKRYRLRKKMGLEHDENLVSYILSL